MRWRLLAAALWLGAASLRAQAPWADWRTIETAHYRVHFPSPYGPWAERMSGSIEAIHEQVTALVGYAPARKTDVLIGDPEASANGMALPFLDRPVIVLWATPPEAESGIGSYRDWTELLVTHEMAHIVHLTRPRNRAGVLARLLPVGPVAIGAPRWVIEGYATLVEGELTGSGRPHSSFRAMVLRRFAIEGKLPSYEAMSASGGWLGGSMAYLVGSGFLEWLEAREGRGSLVKLWKRMASSKGGSFGTAFRAVFGEAPGDLYDRFRAELTAGAIGEEKRLKSDGLVEGEAWQRLRGGTWDLQVSPDGTKLLARRDPSRGRSLLAVWDLSAPVAATAPDKDKRSLADPNEIEEKPESPPQREPTWTLPRRNGRLADAPRWMPDGRSVLFVRRAPDAERVERLDLYSWELASGNIRRLTDGEGLCEADPMPDGRFAIAVRRRYGATELVRVDLATGRTETLPTDVPAGDWPVWSHPRVSPDGSTVAALLHRAGHWRLVALPAAGGAAQELAVEGSPVGAPAWLEGSARLLVATDASGIWDLALVDARSAGPSRALTRVTGAAFEPAPTPDGRGVFFLSLSAKGVDVRRLDLPSPPVALSAASGDAYPILPPAASIEPPRPRVEAAPASAPYRAASTQVLRLFSGFTLGPDGNAWQVGLHGTDVVGQLDWFAAGSFGNAAGPRGGALAGAWSGWPVKLDAYAFASLEKPGSQHLVRRPDLDEQRWGFWAGGTWRRPFDWGSVRVEAGGGWTRVEPLARQSLGGGGAIEANETFSRALGLLRAAASWRSRGDRAGWGLDADVSGAFGGTDGGSWRQVRTEGRAIGYLGPVRLSMAGRLGDTGGSPTRFDVFSIGGASSSIQPAGLDRNRIESPALPEAAQLGRRFDGWRAELAVSILVLYAERLRAFDADPKPKAVEVWGGEARFARLIPIDLAEGLDFYVGLAQTKSRTPAFDSLRGYAGLIYRP